MGFVFKKNVALGLTFLSQVFSYPLPIIIPTMHHIHSSSGGLAVGPLYDKLHRIHFHTRNKTLADLHFLKLCVSTCMSSLINGPKKNMKIKIF